MISIIIPTLNEESVIEATLKSLKRLTLSHEIIVSDGKSTDLTVELARKFADKVIVYSGTARQTIAMGRNDGAKAAQGEFLVFFDADCGIPEPDEFFKIALADFGDEADKPNGMATDSTGKKRLAGLIPNIRVWPDMETFTDKALWSFINRQYILMNNVLNICMSGGEFQMMRADDFRAIGGYNDKLAASEDVDLLRRLAKHGKVMLDQRLTVYHTGRRAHKVGWSTIIKKNVANTLSLWLFGKSNDTEWKVVR